MEVNVMCKRIKLDDAYIARVKKDNAPLMEAVATMEQKKIPCKFCNLRTINKYEDLNGHFSAFCNRCGQVAVYNAADYRHYSYRLCRNDPTVRPTYRI